MRPNGCASGKLLSWGAGGTAVTGGEGVSEIARATSSGGGECAVAGPVQETASDVTSVTCLLAAHITEAIGLAYAGNQEQFWDVEEPEDLEQKLGWQLC